MVDKIVTVTIVVATVIVGVIFAFIFGVIYPKAVAAQEKTVAELKEACEDRDFYNNHNHWVYCMKVGVKPESMEAEQQ